MDKIETAMIFAAKAHKNQTRKGTDIPYITHPFAVGMLLQKEKCSEEVIAAGILHDTLEDTETTFKDLTEAFGVHVANLVLAASEKDRFAMGSKKTTYDRHVKRSIPRGNSSHCCG